MKVQPDITSRDSSPDKDSPGRHLWTLWSFLAGFLVVELFVGLRFYFHEANHSNDGLAVLIGSFRFALLPAIPAGIVTVLLVWGIRKIWIKVTSKS